MAQKPYPTSPIAERQPGDKLAKPDKGGAVAPVALIERLATAIEALEPPRAAPLSAADKLTLSLVEASALSGLSRGYLLGAFHAGNLKAARRGRGWNIKRADLMGQAFIDRARICSTDARS